MLFILLELLGNLKVEMKLIINFVLSIMATVSEAVLIYMLQEI